MPLDALLVEVLACPVDKGPLLLFDDEDLLYNPRLHLAYRVREGIPVMLVDEAVTVDDAEHERLEARAARGEAVGTGPRPDDPGAGST
ncbi:MAG TPA: Trm112 family protein [Acidimicrobiales bacterium]|nr:Trm112 family protein [Acidimicrobiales bacterium]